MPHIEPLEGRLLLSAWYVATTGSDANAGTLARPFATIQHAADVARPGDMVFIRKGTYRETVTPPTSGAARAPITFRPYRKEAVTIDGADLVTGFQPATNGTWTASVPSSLGAGQNQVFQDGQMLPEAQWPNPPANQPLNVDSPPTATATDATATPESDGKATATLTVPDLQDPAGRWVGATIHIAQGQGWVFQTGTVTASSPGSITYTFVPLVPYSFQTPQAGDHFYLTGSPASLDAPGEWYDDAATETLSIIPPSGSLANHSIEMKHRQFAFDLSSRSYIDIVGLNLFACTINTSATSSNLVLEGLSAKYVSQDTLRPDPWSEQFHPHTTGIILNGTNNVLADSTIACSSGDGVFLGGSNNTVQNCTIHDVDYAGGDEAGITTLGAGNHMVSNTIYNCGRSGIVARYSPAASILHNRIYNCALQTTDAGGIYTYMTDGAGTEIAYNVVSDIRTDGFGGAGVYPDNGSAHYLVDHNVVWNCDSALKMNPPSDDNQILNNTFVGVTYGLATSTNPDMTGSTFINNIFVGQADFGPGADVSSNLLPPVNPMFVDANRNDYRLARHSPAIQSGQPLSGTTGRKGTKRPDQGAYAFAKKPFTVGATARKSVRT